MIHHYVPKGLLASCISVIWLSENSFRTNGMERVLPTGTMQLIINLHDSPMLSRGSGNSGEQENIWKGIVAGASMDYLVINTASIVSCLGVVFKPGGAAPFFQLPLTEVRNQRIPLDELWGEENIVLHEQLLAAKSPQACFRTLERFLEHKLGSTFDAGCKSKPFISHAVNQLTLSPGDRSLERLKEQSGYAETRFINLFSGEVGLTPKQFFRVQRFQRVLRNLFNSRDADWPDLALQFGYYDQAHFIHEFKTFTGITPGQYYNKRIGEQNHLAF